MEMWKDTEKKKERTGRESRGALLRMVTATAAAAVLLTGCGASARDAKSADIMWEGAYETGSTMMEYGYDAGVVNGMPAESADMAGNVTEDVTVQTNRKLIKNVELSVETKTFDDMLTVVEARISALGGYIESSEVYNGSAYSGYRSSRDASMVLRIPQERLEEFLQEVSDISNVIRRSDSVEDVTLSYVDMESHRDALRTEQTRLLELLERAETLEDVLTIEERLTSVRYQLESMESQLRTMDNQIDFSTVYLSVSEVKELTPVTEKGMWQRIADGFAGSLRDIAEDAEELFVWGVVNLPYLVIWAAVLLLVIFGIRRHIRRKTERAARKKETAQGERKKDENAKMPVGKIKE